MKKFLVALILTLSIPLAAQVSSYDDLVFEDDSITSKYKPSGKNFIYIKSKKGSGGMAKSPAVDSISSLPVTDIVLVFTETSPDAISDRATSNQERWENLLQAHPQIFQFSTNYKNLCQCNNSGDAEAFKQVQGFYIYYTKAQPPKVEEPKVEEKKPEKEVATSSNSKSKEEPVKEKVKEKEKEKEKPKEKEVAKVKEKEKETEKEKEEEKSEDVAVEGPAKTVTMSESDFKSSAKKKEGYTKPKRAKDAKACRPPCYENGDEDLNAFFKDNITLTKKQRRHSKSLVSQVTLMLNFDGSIKKAMVTGQNEELNQLVLAAVKNMNLWNPAVKGGVTVKSQVKMTLKYDKESKGMKPFEVMITPRPTPKCMKCMSDAEIFGE